MMIQTIDHNSSNPPVDGRTQVRHGHLCYDLPTYPTLAAWEARAAHLRRRILTGAGLWPTPERCSLRPRVTGQIEHEDYSVENVFFESWPDFYVCGNLYHPKGNGPPFPGVLCPHGHWAHGRLQDIERGSIPARCVALARQGYIAFAYDMIGYNDSGMQVAGHAAELDDGGPDDGPHKRHFHAPRHFLWGISLLGLQLWNSVRALDYLASLPDIDRARLGCTGASGGGTQTFLLCAIDERVRVAAPVNMVSAHFQGGCVCENAPNLRLEGTNVEFAALMAPRPLLMVSATGDWTVNTPEVEYPAVRAIYRLYGAGDRVATVQVDAPHNYNRQSRETVYAWFGRWLLGDTDAEALKERPYQVDPPERMRVFRNGTCHSEEPFDGPQGELYDKESLAAKPEPKIGRDSALPHPALSAVEGVAQNDRSRGVAQNDSARESGIALPAEAVTPEQLTEYLIGQAKMQIKALQPRDAATLHAYRETMGVAYWYALNARLPQPGELQVERAGVEERAGGSGMPGHRVERLILGRKEAGERTPALLYVPRGPVGAVLVVHPEGREGAISIAPSSLLAHLLARRLAVLTLDAYGTGELAALERDKTVDHFLCFNRSDAALRVQDVLNGIAYLATGAGARGQAQDAPVPGAASDLASGAMSRILPIHLVGLGAAGLWCLLARALCGAGCDAHVARTVVDAAQFACDDDRAWLDALYLPHIRRAGDLRTAAALIAPGPLYVHNAAPGFPSAFFRQVYQAAAAPDAVHIQEQEANVETIVGWLAGQVQGYRLQVSG
jgi:dienelactone hydrolase